MTITYLNGRTTEGILLSRNPKAMRVALKGSDDVAEFASVNGAWISEDSECVQVRFVWQRQIRKRRVSEADCMCPKTLADRLIQMLWTGDGSQLAERHSG
jgi:hypothetical protein